MAKREKKIVISGITNEKMESAMADFAKADARIQKITATMDVEMTRIREKYQEELGKLTEEKEKAFEVLQVYATEQRDALFSKNYSWNNRFPYRHAEAEDIERFYMGFCYELAEGVSPGLYPQD